MKREIAAVVKLCDACVKGASRLDDHKNKQTLILSVRDRTPEKKKGKGAGDTEEQSPERKSTRGPAEHELFIVGSAFALS
jgi:hypothetical protein